MLDMVIRICFQKKKKKKLKKKWVNKSIFKLYRKYVSIFGIAVPIMDFEFHFCLKL